jgi:hypothetical protein
MKRRIIQVVTLYNLEKNYSFSEEHITAVFIVRSKPSKTTTSEAGGKLRGTTKKICSS